MDDDSTQTPPHYNVYVQGYCSSTTLHNFHITWSGNYNNYFHWTAVDSVTGRSYTCEYYSGKGSDINEAEYTCGWSLSGFIGDTMVGGSAGSDLGQALMNANGYYGYETMQDAITNLWLSQ